MAKGYKLYGKREGNIRVVWGGVVDLVKVKKESEEIDGKGKKCTGAQTWGAGQSGGGVRAAVRRRNITFPKAPS